MYSELLGEVNIKKKNLGKVKESHTHHFSNSTFRGKSGQGRVRPEQQGCLGRGTCVQAPGAPWVSNKASDLPCWPLCPLSWEPSPGLSPSEHSLPTPHKGPNLTAASPRSGISTPITKYHHLTFAGLLCNSESHFHLLPVASHEPVRKAQHCSHLTASETKTQTG